MNELMQKITEKLNIAIDKAPDVLFLKEVLLGG